MDIAGIFSWLFSPREGVLVLLGVIPVGFLIAAIVYLVLTYLSSLLLKAITGKMTAPDNTKRHQGNQTVDLGLPSSN